MFKRHYLATLFSLALIVLTSACGNAPATPSTKSTVPSAVTIAYQPGLTDASLIVLKQRGTLEKQFPHTTIQWRVFQSGAAVREAIIANQAQIGYAGVPPFLVGWDHGVNWRILASLSREEAWLVTKNPRLKTLKDFTPADKIGVAAPDALQAIMLREAAQKQLGNAHALDNNLESITSADGVQAVLNGQLAAHFPTPPYSFQEAAAPGTHVILKSYDITGEASNDVIGVPQTFYDQYPDFTKQLYQDLIDSTEFVNKHHDQAAQYLSQEQGGKPDAVQFQTWLDEPGMFFNTTPAHVLNYATFMKSIGLISKAPHSIKELELPLLNGSGS